MRRVAVTGLGVVSPLGLDADSSFRQAAAGRSAVGLLGPPWSDRIAAPLAATVRGFDASTWIDAAQLRLLDRVSQFALEASRQALAQRGEVPGAPVAGVHSGVFVGTGMGGTQTSDDGYRVLYGERSDRIRPATIVAGMYNAPAAWIALAHGVQGPTLTYTTACSSAAVAIGEAWLRIASGTLDLALAGGSEAPLALGSMKAWEVMRTLARVDDQDPAASCKPFSLDRSGMVLAEGAAMLVLEPLEDARRRGVPILGEIAGYGLGTDSGHITRPTVEAQAQAMQAALHSAGWDVAQVDAINAHGTGTQANDEVEAAAIHRVFGACAARLPVSATKAVHGHLLGAAGALECVLSLLSMQRSVLLPTAHRRRPDPACVLDLVADGARDGVRISRMLSSSFAFGGTNAVLALADGR